MVVDQTLKVNIKLILQSLFREANRDILEHYRKVRGREVLLVDYSYVFLL